MNEKQRGISGFVLKLIAVVTMLIDHSAVAILERALKSSSFAFVKENWHTWRNIYMVLRGVGRMAFPIYCFLLVEGFVHTKNRGKYALRLFLFALISEIPFDLALFPELGVHGLGEYFRHISDSTNVFFTLLIGLLMIWGIDEVRQKSFAMILQMLLMFVIFVAAAGAAYFLHTDYSAAGIVAILVLYVLRNRRMIGFALAVVLLALLSSMLELAALFMLIPMAFYNGTRGRQAKYFFYAFYPAHLVVLAVVAWAIGLPIFY